MVSPAYCFFLIVFCITCASKTHLEPIPSIDNQYSPTYVQLDYSFHKALFMVSNFYFTFDFDDVYGCLNLPKENNALIYGIHIDKMILFPFAIEMFDIQPFFQPSQEIQDYFALDNVCSDIFSISYSFNSSTLSFDITCNAPTVQERTVMSIGVSLDSIYQTIDNLDAVGFYQSYNPDVVSPDMIVFNSINVSFLTEIVMSSSSSLMQTDPDTHEWTSSYAYAFLVSCSPNDPSWVQPVFSLGDTILQWMNQLFTCNMNDYVELWIEVCFIDSFAQPLIFDTYQLVNADLCIGGLEDYCADPAGKVDDDAWLRTPTGGVVTLLSLSTATTVELASLQEASTAPGNSSTMFFAMDVKTTFFVKSASLALKTVQYGGCDYTLLDDLILCTTDSRVYSYPLWTEPGLSAAASAHARLGTCQLGPLDENAIDGDQLRYPAPIMSYPELTSNDQDEHLGIFHMRAMYLNPQIYLQAFAKEKEYPRFYFSGSYPITTEKTSGIHLRDEIDASAVSGALEDFPLFYFEQCPSGHYCPSAITDDPVPCGIDQLCLTGSVVPVDYSELITDARAESIYPPEYNTSGDFISAFSDFVLGLISKHFVVSVLFGLVLLVAVGAMYLRMKDNLKDKSINPQLVIDIKEFEAYRHGNQELFEINKSKGSMIGGFVLFVVVVVFAICAVLSVCLFALCDGIDSSSFVNADNPGNLKTALSTQPATSISSEKRKLKARLDSNFMIRITTYGLYESLSITFDSMCMENGVSCAPRISRGQSIVELEFSNLTLSWPLKLQLAFNEDDEQTSNPTGMLGATTIGMAQNFSVSALRFEVFEHSCKVNDGCPDDQCFIGTTDEPWPTGHRIVDEPILAFSLPSETQARNVAQSSTQTLSGPQVVNVERSTLIWQRKKYRHLVFKQTTLGMANLYGLTSESVAALANSTNREALTLTFSISSNESIVKVISDPVVSVVGLVVAFSILYTTVLSVGKVLLPLLEKADQISQVKRVERRARKAIEQLERLRLIGEDSSSTNSHGESGSDPEHT
eukprot:gnl/Dysnectes_brevis/6072_a9138_415.p1 GENE.gnl/Dysnectes_brevis/6072_a9138_415~~gnl/Dysnectes_brevis/6072_a9138_415.p1  ORF type:complete len:1029 (-),score=171.56 gnl/Dysnectes_brevis/6072_a9138_415:112-3198(-)